MINREHDELEFDFPVDGEEFSTLHYLVDGIYPQLSRFLSPESNSHTKLAFSFAADQEAHRKDIKRGYGVLKLKFIARLHPITLCDCNNICYVVLASILMHNMMVEVCLKN